MAADAFQKFKSSFNRGVTTISIKTSSSLEKVKIKTHIESIEAEVARLITAIGEATYTIWENGDRDITVLGEHLALIKQKREEIAQLQSEYEAIDERGSQILGTPVEEAPQTGPEQKAEAGVVCPNCGARYTTAVNFCRKCGTRLNEQ